MSPPQPTWSVPLSVYDYDAPSFSYKLRYVIEAHDVQTDCAAFVFPLTLNNSTFAETTRAIKRTHSTLARIPAFILCSNNDLDLMQVYDSFGKRLPVVVRNIQQAARIRVIHAFEMMCVNLSSVVASYYTADSGQITLDGVVRQHCITYRIAPSIGISGLSGDTLRQRQFIIDKLVKDSRMVIESPRAISVYNPFTTRITGILSNDSCCCGFKTKRDDASDPESVVTSPRIRKKLCHAIPA